MTNDHDRFGVPEALILEVIRKHRGIIRAGCYVPTRHEIASASPERVHRWLLDWWWESPAELIPSDEQVAGGRNPEAASGRRSPVYPGALGGRPLIGLAPNPRLTCAHVSETKGRKPMRKVLSHKAGWEMKSGSRNPQTQMRRCQKDLK